MILFYMEKVVKNSGESKVSLDPIFEQKTREMSFSSRFITLQTTRTKRREGFVRIQVNSFKMGRDEIEIRKRSNSLTCLKDKTIPQPWFWFSLPSWIRNWIIIKFCMGLNAILRGKNVLNCLNISSLKEGHHLSHRLVKDKFYRIKFKWKFVQDFSLTKI